MTSLEAKYFDLQLRRQLSRDPPLAAYQPLGRWGTWRPPSAGESSGISFEIAKATKGHAPLSQTGEYEFYILCMRSLLEKDIMVSTWVQIISNIFMFKYIVHPRSSVWCTPDLCVHFIYKEVMTGQNHGKFSSRFTASKSIQTASGKSG